MQFMLFVCAGPGLRLSPEDRAALPGEVEGWATDLAGRGIQLMGHVFEPVADAKTIRRRNDDLRITDGPVNSADEPIAGFNLLECNTLEEAVEVSASHPHQIINRTGSPIRVLMLSSMVGPEIVHYPDTEKVAASGADGEPIMLARRGPTLEYWEGEE